MTPLPENLETLDEDGLLELIGADLARHEHPALPFNKSELIAKARKWADENKQVLRTTICNDETIRNLVKRSATRQQLGVAISDLIVGLCTGIAPMTVAYLLTKMGLEEMCAEEWLED